jgi:hypothetical protein
MRAAHGVVRKAVIACCATGLSLGGFAYVPAAASATSVDDNIDGSVSQIISQLPDALPALCVPNQWTIDVE